jgi:membrane protease YdiL (CAAX protease family)
MGYLKYMYHRLFSFYDSNNSYNRVSKAFTFIWSMNVFIIMELPTITNKYPNILSFVITFLFATIMFYMLQSKKKYSILLKDAEKNNTKVNSILFIIHITVSIMIYAIYIYFKYKAFKML